MIMYIDEWSFIAHVVWNRPVPSPSSFLFAPIKEKNPLLFLFLPLLFSRDPRPDLFSNRDEKRREIRGALRGNYSEEATASRKEEEGGREIHINHDT